MSNVEDAFKCRPECLSPGTPADGECIGCKALTHQSCCEKWKCHSYNGQFSCRRCHIERATNLSNMSATNAAKLEASKKNNNTPSSATSLASNPSNVKSKKNNNTPSSATSLASNPSNVKTPSLSKDSVRKMLPSSSAVNKASSKSALSKTASSNTASSKIDSSNAVKKQCHSKAVGKKSKSKTRNDEPDDSFPLLPPAPNIVGIPIALSSKNPIFEDLLKRNASSLKRILVPFKNESFVKGTVQRIPKKGKQKELYKVNWNFTALGESTISESDFYEGIRNNTLISSYIDEEDEHLPSDSRTKRLLSHCPAEELVEFHSDEEDEISLQEDENAEYPGVPENDKDDVANEKEYFLFRLLHPELDEPNHDIEGDELECGSPDSDDDISGLLWDTDAIVDPPSWKLSKKVATLKEADYIQSLFTAPVDSFLAFCPLLWFRKITHESNLYARDKFLCSDGTIRVAGNLLRPITVDEILTFHGIMIMMAVNPFPG
jgi:hypothetical protein